MYNQGGGGNRTARRGRSIQSREWTLKGRTRRRRGVLQRRTCSIRSAASALPAFSGNPGWHWFREKLPQQLVSLVVRRQQEYLARHTSVPTPPACPLRASWDSDHEVAVLFGGEGSKTARLCTTRTSIWKRMYPSLSRAASAGTMAYHKELKKHILFGTQFGDDKHTWAYDLAKNEWTDLNPAVQPPTKENDAVLAYDEINKVIVASIRAQGEQGWQYETWIYEHVKNTWTKMTPNSSRRVVVNVAASWSRFGSERDLDGELRQSAAEDSGRRTRTANLDVSRTIRRRTRSRAAT